jgi:hypothetical protein
MTVYLEEFSAVSDGARAAIDLAERLRDAGVGVVFVVQSYEGLGDEHQAARLLGSSAALIVHRMPQPERLLAAAGTIWTPEQTWQLDQWGPDGHASLRMTPRPLVDPDAVRRAEVGEAWIIAAGRSLHLQVAETPYTAQPAELPSPHRDGLAVVQERPPWVVDLPDQEPAAATVRGRGPRALPRPGGHRHQVRVPIRPRGPPGGALQPPRAYPPSRGWLAPAARRRRHRPALPTPRRPRGGHRGRRWSGQGLDRGGEGEALRPVGGRLPDDPTRPRRPTGHRAPERVLAVVAGARGRDHPHPGGARDRLSPSARSARASSPARSTRRRRSTAPTSAAPSPASPPKHGRPTRPWSTCWGGSRPASTPPRPRSRWPGCSPRSPGSCRSPAPAGWSAWTRTSEQPASS